MLKIPFGTIKLMAQTPIIKMIDFFLFLGRLFCVQYLHCHKYECVHLSMNFFSNQWCRFDFYFLPFFFLKPFINHAFTWFGTLLVYVSKFESQMATKITALFWSVSVENRVKRRCFWFTKGHKCGGKCSEKWQYLVILFLETRDCAARSRGGFNWM